jgi:hypothetical protein
MKRCLVTQAVGEKWTQVLELTKQRMLQYAERHKLDFLIIQEPIFPDIPQYDKLSIAKIMIERGYDQATFIDADCLITTDCEDISTFSDTSFIAFNEGEYDFSKQENPFYDRKDVLKGLAETLGGNVQPKFYINSGVFVTNSRHLGVFSLPPFGLFPNYFGEQTWLNLMLHLWNVDVKFIEPKYNLMYGVEKLIDINRYKDAKILHYAGKSNDMDNLLKLIKDDEVVLSLMGR